MSRDYLMHATPAIARRLKHLQRYCRLDLSPEIIELATSGTIDETLFPALCPYTEERATIVQFLVDSDLRGVVQNAHHPCMDVASILFCGVAAGITKVTVIGERVRPWRTAAKALGITDIFAAKRPGDGAWVDDRRDGLLIIDVDQPPMALSWITREFPRTLIYHDEPDANLAIEWIVLSSILFPDLPSEGWHQHLPLFYGACIFPEFQAARRV